MRHRLASLHIARLQAALQRLLWPTIPTGLSQRDKLITIFGGFLVIVGLLQYIYNYRSLATIPGDFSQDYYAAWMLRTERSIYTKVSQADLAATGSTVDATLLVSNYHPPFDAVMFIPLTFLSYKMATTLWSMLSLGLYLLIGVVLVRECNLKLTDPWRIVLLGSALCWPPFQGHIAVGQLSLLLTAMIVVGWMLLRHQYNVLAGVCFGIASLIKLFPGLLLLYLLLARRWHSLGAMIVTIGLGTVFTLAFVGLPDMLHYINYVAPHDVLLFGPYPTNVSINGTFGRLLINGGWVTPIVTAPQLASILTLISNAALLLLLMQMLWVRKPSQPKMDTAFAFTCVAMLLISPISWEHAFPLLALPLGLLLRDHQVLRVPGQTSMLLGIFILISWPLFQTARILLSWYAPDRVPWYAALPLSASTLGMLLLAWLLVKRSRADVDKAVLPTSC